MFLSVVVIAELRHGAARYERKDPAQAAVFETRLNRIIATYKDYTIHIDRQTALRWGDFMALSRNLSMDALIAATADVHDLIVVTRNVKDMAAFPVPLLNPFVE